MKSAEQIVDMYYDCAGYENILPNYRSKSISAVEYIMNNGIKSDKIERAIKYYLDCYECYGDKPYLNMASIFNLDDMKEIIKIRVNKDNLLENNKFYYHKALRKMPKPPTINVVDGNIIRKTEPYFLEIIEEFTYKDMLEYFYEQHKVKSINKKEKRDIAALKYLIDLYKEDPDCSFVDIILYMIDVSRAKLVEDNKPFLSNILQIQDYYTEAIDLLLDKINYERINGIDKVVSRTECG